MRTISLHVEDEAYARFRKLSELTNKPIAFLIREAMQGYLEANQARSSLLAIEPQESGALINPWSRSEIYEEMLER